jgi:hypothetical protein
MAPFTFTATSTSPPPPGVIASQLSTPAISAT